MGRAGETGSTGAADRMGKPAGAGKTKNTPQHKGSAQFAKNKPQGKAQSPKNTRPGSSAGHSVRGGQVKSSSLSGPASAPFSSLFTRPETKEFNQMAAELEALAGQLRASLRPKAAHFKNLPYDVAALSNLLTEERAHLARPYWSEARYLAAYLWYFLPWNLVRLLPLLANLPLNIRPGYTVLDLGSGPLTLPIALWLARPDLRTTPINFICTDTQLPPMQAGSLIFANIAGPDHPWHLELKKADLKEALGQFRQQQHPPSNAQPEPHSPRRTQMAVDLISACNVLNELKRPREVSMQLFLKNIMQDMRGVMVAPTQPGKLPSKLNEQGKPDQIVNPQDSASNAAAKKPSPHLLIVEPGNRLGGKIISMLRQSGMELGLSPLLPCPHSEPCPMLQAPLPGTAKQNNASGQTVANLEGEQPALKLPLKLPAQLKGQPPAPRTWCHFVQSAPPVPEWLQDISKLAGLVKTHTALSFVLLNVKNGAHEAHEDMDTHYTHHTTAALGHKTPECLGQNLNSAPSKSPAFKPESGFELYGRIVSNPFAVPGQPGFCRYACTSQGLVLVPNVATVPSGALLPLQPNSQGVDAKSGANIMHPIRANNASNGPLPASKACLRPFGGKHSGKTLPSISKVKCPRN